ncbi:MAG: HAMP domain-containing histidine kinase [Myxococcales bacterium]|nr:HAMP domain-containing histidine kinase [Myxococcales bacterium]
MARRSPRSLRERVFYFALIPAIVVAVLLLGAAALRTTVQIEKARQQSVFDATYALAEERTDRLDKAILAEDNALMASVDVARLAALRRGLPTAPRETPTVRALVVVTLGVPDPEVAAFAARQPGPDDDRLRRVLVQRLLPNLDLGAAAAEELRYLHQVDAGQSYLLSYWQRSVRGVRYVVIACHDVGAIVGELMPRLYRDIDRSSRMNVIDEDGRILFGPPIQAGGIMVGLHFPATLHKWRLQVALTSSEGLADRAVRQRLVQLLVVAVAMLIAIVGVAIVVRGSIQERRLAALKSDFVANVSHELKTPLASVRMFGEMLLTGRVASEDKRREYLQIIVGESERLSALIDNVLDFAKVERGKSAYEFAACDVVSAVARAVELLRYRAEQQTMSIKLVSTPSPAVCDARAIELAVMNMIDNALKYAAGTEVVEVEVRPDNGGVLVRVADRGPGIPVEERDRIFERFERGRQAREVRARGSGIGLALVKNVALAHRGSVRVVSPAGEDGRGTAFELRLTPAPGSGHG